MAQHKTLLSAAEVQALPEVRRPHPLDPDLVRHTRSLGDAAGLSTIGVHFVRLTPVLTDRNLYAFGGATMTVTCAALAVVPCPLRTGPGHRALARVWSCSAIPYGPGSMRNGGTPNELPIGT